MDTDVSCLASCLAARIRGQPVAIVGNATTLLSGDYGREIDKRCVVRMNAGIPMKPNAQGRRVDIHCFSSWPNLKENMKKVTCHPTDASYFDAALRIWMSPSDRGVVGCLSCKYYPQSMWATLAERLGARPSVGAMVVDLFASLVEADVTLFGFDFKSSGTFYRSRQHNGPHDWHREREFVLGTAEAKGWAVRVPRADKTTFAARVTRAILLPQALQIRSKRQRK